MPPLPFRLDAPFAAVCRRRLPPPPPSSMPPLSHPLASSRPTALARRPPCHHRHLHRLALTAALPPKAARQHRHTPHLALSEPPRGAPAVPSKLNESVASGAGGASLSSSRAFPALLCVPMHALHSSSVSPASHLHSHWPCALGRGVARHARGSLHWPCALGRGVARHARGSLHAAALLSPPSPPAPPSPPPPLAAATAPTLSPAPALAVTASQDLLHYPRPFPRRTHPRPPSACCQSHHPSPSPPPPSSPPSALRPLPRRRGPPSQPRHP